MTITNSGFSNGSSSDHNPADPLKASHHQTAGFTLIEVAIALGIIAFALVALMGMLPIGLDSLHDSKRNTIDARIVQQMSTMLRLSDWSTPGSTPGTDGGNTIINSYNGVLYYFDSDGNQIGSSQKPPANSNLITYTAQLTINNKSATSGNVTLPGTSQSNSFLLSFTVLITDLPANVSDRFSFSGFPALQHSRNTLMYTTLVSQSSGA